MFDLDTVLALLQHGDSAFPAGGFAFSWGAEGLAADGFLEDAKDLDDLIFNHLVLRWNGMDRVLLERAFRAQDLDAVAAIDLYTETATSSEQMREGSRRAGRALLGVSMRTGGALSSAYRLRIAADERLGHLPPAQALVYRDAGMHADAAQLLSAWTLVTGLVSAATRLGCVGHLEAQKCLKTARGLLVELLAEPCDPDAEPWSFTPVIDIAVSRGPGREVRMFST